MIKDAQPVNDADGELNGIIVDPGAPGTAPSRDLLAIDDSTIAETAVENDGSGQQFIGIYPAGTTATDIITEVGVMSGMSTITQIVLSITGIGADSTVVVTHANNPFATPSSAGNGEFTFGDGTGSGVTVEAAETFLKSLEFGINSDEPTGPVTLELSIRGSEGAATTETATRPITEENDPVKVVGLADGAEFTVQVSNLEGFGSIPVIEGINVNDGGDDSGISVVIAPTTFNLPTAVDPSVMGTLTLSYSLVGEDFTLNVSSDVALASTEVMPTLSFSDGRSTETRGITIAIVTRGLTLLAIDDSTIAETAVENDDSGQQFIGIYPAGTIAIDIITEVGVTSGTFTITQIRLNVTGSSIETTVMHNSSFYPTNHKWK